MSFEAEALGIEWTLTATDSVRAAYAGAYEVEFSVTAEIPDDLSLLMDEGETIDPQWIMTAEAKIAGLQDFKLIEAPNGVSGWLDLAGPSANSCKDNNGSFACAQAKSTEPDAADITAGAVHTWTWVGNVSDLEAVFAEDGSGLKHIGAHLASDDHPNGWNVSEGPGSAVPEPSAALVFGSGLLVAGGALRRRAATR